ncbi:hypothetical protein GQ600_10484 [Phytophthora cactorum]|nr:hypothetical protein GQ600_10484 [Phytophthora cactorum]
MLATQPTQETLACARKSSLFFLTSISYLGNGLSGDKEDALAKHFLFEVSCAPTTALENPG